AAIQRRLSAAVQRPATIVDLRPQLDRSRTQPAIDARSSCAKGGVGVDSIAQLADLAIIDEHRHALQPNTPLAQPKPASVVADAVQMAPEHLQGLIHLAISAASTALGRPRHWRV